MRDQFQKLLLLQWLVFRQLKTKLSPFINKRKPKAKVQRRVKLEPRKALLNGEIWLKPENKAEVLQRKENLLQTLLLSLPFRNPVMIKTQRRVLKRIGPIPRSMLKWLLCRTFNHKTSSLEHKPLKKSTRQLLKWLNILAKQKGKGCWVGKKGLFKLKNSKLISNLMQIILFQMKGNLQKPDNKLRAFLKHLH